MLSLRENLQVMMLNESASNAATSLVKEINKATGLNFEYQDKFAPDGKIGLLYSSDDRKGLQFRMNGGSPCKIDYWKHITMNSKGYPDKPERTIIIQSGNSDESIAKTVQEMIGGKMTEADDALADSQGLPKVVNGEAASYGTTSEESSNKAIATENSQREVTPAFLKDLLSDKLNGMKHGDFDGLLIYGDPGVGKAQPDSMMIPTPSGMKRFGDLEIGDCVFDKDGNPTKVLEIHPQGERDVYEATFEDKRTARCDIEHLWHLISDEGSEILPLKDFMNECNAQGKHSSAKSVPLGGAAKFNEKGVAIDPWVLGVFLASGDYKNELLGLTESGNRISQAVASACGFEREKDELTYTCHFKKDGQLVLAKDFFKDYPDAANPEIDKAIPEDYIFNSEAVRLRLLQGMFDAGGHRLFSPESRCRFDSKSKRLTDSMQFVLRSLGFKAQLLANARPSDEAMFYMLVVDTEDASKPDLFSICQTESENEFKPKASEHNRLRLTEVKRLGREPQRCILVDNPEHLYLCENFVATHNTFPVKKFLKENGIKFRKLSGTITMAGLFMALWENRKPNQWLLFDDIDSVFKDEAMRNLIKAALDTARDEREITYKTKTNSFNAAGMTDEEMEKAVADSGNKKYPDTFLYQGKIIFISNLTTAQIESAILSRTQKVNYELTPAQIWDLTESMMDNFEIARNPPHLIRKLVLEIMRKNWKLKEKPSFRVYMSACATFMRVYQTTQSEEKAVSMVLYEIGGL